MRWALAAVLMSLAAGCGYSESDVRNAANEAAARTKADADANQAAQNAAVATCNQNRDTALASREQRINDLENNIKTALGDVTRSAGNDEVAAGWRFAIQIETLRQPEWKWTEDDNLAGVDSTQAVAVGQFDRIRYTVNPGRLVPHVEVASFRDSPSVRFRCTAGNCIHAVGRRLVHRTDGSEGFDDIDEWRDSDDWPVGTQNRAEGLSNMMSELLLLLRQSPPECTAPVQ